MNFTYRVINLGAYKWIVRRFRPDMCEEQQFYFKTEGDPELRSTEKKVIEEADRLGKWIRL